MVSFDRNERDGKLVDWDLTFFDSVNDFKTTDAVIRFERENELSMLGPPDSERSHSVYWYFDDDQGRELLSVSLTVHRMGEAFVCDLSVTDEENAPKLQTPAAENTGAGNAASQ
jgi:hypothetical protein